MTKALRDGCRAKVFLMTKIDGCSKAEAAKQLGESPRHLQTGCIDPIQRQEVIRFDDPAPELRRRRGYFVGLPKRFRLSVEDSLLSELRLPMCLEVTCDFQVAWSS
jgi:hypothetical protein